VIVAFPSVAVLFCKRVFVMVLLGIAPTTLPVMPLTVPPVIATAFAFWVDIVPSPDTAELAIAMVTLPALVMRPCASTTICETAEALP
jgi:hypothetical protein